MDIKRFIIHCKQAKKTNTDATNAEPEQKQRPLLLFIRFPKM